MAVKFADHTSCLPDHDACRCRAAVNRAFYGMAECGDKVAIDVATRVYQHHHPESCYESARCMVENWVFPQRGLH